MSRTTTRDGTDQRGPAHHEGAHTARFAQSGPRTPRDLCAFGSALLSDALAGRIDVSQGRLAASGARVMISAANVGERVGASTDLIAPAGGVEANGEDEEVALLRRLEQLRRERDNG